MDKVSHKSFLVVFALVMFLLSLPSPAVYFFEGEHDVDYVIPNDDPDGGLAIDVNATVNLLPGAWVQGGYYLGEIYCNGTLNIYGGKVDGPITCSADIATVTLYGSNLVLNDGTGDIPIDPATEYISGTDYRYFTLSGLYQDGTPFSLNFALEWMYTPENRKLYLNQPQAAPEIDVTPALLFWDLGEVPIGEPDHTVVVQIFSFGNAPLTVSSIGLTADSSPDFRIVAGPEVPFTMEPDLSLCKDITIEFLPTAAGLTSAVLQIVSDDPDEGLVEVVLTGTGMVVDIPPTQLVADILAFFDAALENGTIIGYAPGKGNSACNRVRALRHMVEAAGVFVNTGDYASAIDQLEAVAKKTDGANRPPDFVVGEDVAILNAMVNDLIAALQM